MNKVVCVLFYSAIMVSCGSYEPQKISDINRLKAEKFIHEYNGKFHNGLFYYTIAKQGIIQFHEHSCCSGQGYDIVLIKFEDGDIYRSDMNYCSGKTVLEEVESATPKNGNDIKVKLKSMGFIIINEIR